MTPVCRGEALCARCLFGRASMMTGSCLLVLDG
jgi:hypothetical protein